MRLRSSTPFDVILKQDTSISFTRPTFVSGIPAAPVVVRKNGDVITGTTFFLPSDTLSVTLNGASQASLIARLDETAFGGSFLDLSRGDWTERLSVTGGDGEIFTGKRVGARLRTAVGYGLRDILVEYWGNPGSDAMQDSVLYVRADGESASAYTPISASFDGVLYRTQVLYRGTGVIPTGGFVNLWVERPSGQNVWSVVTSPAPVLHNATEAKGLNSYDTGLTFTAEDEIPDVPVLRAGFLSRPVPEFGILEQPENTTSANLKDGQFMVDFSTTPPTLRAKQSGVLYALPFPT